MAILIDHGNLKRSVLRSRRLEKANKIRQELREKYDYIPWLNRIIPKFSKKVHKAEALPRFYSCAYVD